MKIPLVDLQKQYISIKEEIDSAIGSVIKGAAFIQGKYVEAFEREFAAYCSAKHCVGVGNGTDALFIALKGFGIGPGDEVIVPANSFIATSEAVSMTGATVVFVDCDPETYTMDPRRIPRHLTPKTKAIIPVHLYGRPAEMPSLCRLSQKYNLTVIQDCAQAHGATIDNKPLSCFGDALCFSFYPGKNLGAYGDAGAIVTNDDASAERMRMFANHGRLSKYDHQIEGMNSRMDGIQGAILRAKLKHLDAWIEKRRAHAEEYHRLLSEIDRVAVPLKSDHNRHVYHLYVIRTQERDGLQRFLKDQGIATGIHYPVILPNLTAYRKLGYTNTDYPVADRYQDQILSLPMYPELTRDMIEAVVHAIDQYFK